MRKEDLVQKDSGFSNFKFRFKQPHLCRNYTKVSGAELPSSLQVWPSAFPKAATPPRLLMCIQTHAKIGSNCHPPLTPKLRVHFVLNLGSSPPLVHTPWNFPDPPCALVLTAASYSRWCTSCNVSPGPSCGLGICPIICCHTWRFGWNIMLAVLKC